MPREHRPEIPRPATVSFGVDAEIRINTTSKNRHASPPRLQATLPCCSCMSLLLLKHPRDWSSLAQGSRRGYCFGRDLKKKITAESPLLKASFFGVPLTCLSPAWLSLTPCLASFLLVLICMAEPSRTESHVQCVTAVNFFGHRPPNADHYGSVLASACLVSHLRRFLPCKAGQFSTSFTPLVRRPLKRTYFVRSWCGLPQASSCERI